MEKKRRRERRMHASPAVRMPCTGFVRKEETNAYIEAHLSSLKNSPLRKRVFSPGRRVQSSPFRRTRACHRHTQRPISTPDKRARTTPALRVGKRSSAGRAHFTNGLQQPQHVDGPVPLSTSPHFHESARSTIPRPVTAPAVRRVTAEGVSRRSSNDHPEKSWKRLSSSRIEQRYHPDDRDISAATKKEARLLEKLAKLSGAHNNNTFPTVSALKTAVAIQSVQAQLRDCSVIHRTSNRDSQRNPPISITAAANTQRAVNSKAGPPIERGSGRSGSREPRAHKPWDTRYPSVSAGTILHPNNKRCTSTTNSDRRPASAPVLRLLTSKDPVFGNAEGYDQRRSSRSHSANGGSRAGDNQDGQQKTAPRSARASSIEESDKIAARERVRESFERLTVGILVELGHVRNPPKPVRSVLLALACLLGWRRTPSRRSPPRALFGNAYVLRAVLSSIQPRRISGRRRSTLAGMLREKYITPARVKGANAAAASLLEWLVAVVALAAIGADGKQDKTEEEKQATVSHADRRVSGED